MLIRSAGRRQQRKTSQLLAASFAQLQLPWLAPAQLRWSASSVAAPSPPRSGVRKPRSPSPQAARRLATATDTHTAQDDSPFPPPGYGGDSHGSDTSYQHVPWDTRPQFPAHQPRVSNIRPYRDPIIINSSVQTAAPLIKVQQGVHGTVADLLQHLHTSLRVGRLGRAEAIIQRLADQCAPSSPEIVHAHKSFLGEFLRSIATHTEGSEVALDTFKQMSKWFEMEVRAKDVEPDAAMLVLMIRGAIRAMGGKQRDRAVRRYAVMARDQDNDMFHEVLESEDYDDNEFTVVGRVSSEHFGEEMEALAAEQLDAPSEVKVTTKYGRPDAMHDVPEVLDTQQKGEGLVNVKRSIAAFHSLPPLPSDAPMEDQRARAFERQYQMEKTAVDIAIEQWRKADTDLRKLGVYSSMQTKPIEALMWQWYEALLPALQEELAACRRLLALEKSKSEDDRYAYGPYLEMVPLESVTANTILQTLTSVVRGKDQHTSRFQRDVKLATLTIKLADTLEQECAVSSAKILSPRQRDARKKIDKRKLLRLLRQSRDADAEGNGSLGQKGSFDTASSPAIGKAGAIVNWPTTIKVKLGAMLVSKLVETAQVSVTREHPRTREKVTAMQPAFQHKMPYSSGKKIGMLDANPALVEKLESEPIPSLIAKRLPMVVEPRTWNGFNQGGYWHYPTPIIRLKTSDKTGRSYYMAAHEKGDTSQVMAGLNALGKVPWVVNREVFKVQLDAWNSGKAIANFAPLDPESETPPEPNSSSEPGLRAKWLMECRALENKRIGLHSKRCFQNFQMEIARAMLNETMYFPHNIDFRGRAYPIPPYLNHMGADNARGLLVFAEGKELGPHGLRWLKIHLANVAGYDKASLKEREDYAMSHLDDIYDSVHNPLDGKRWWLESEDAWQTLAACFELVAALDSPDPERYVSHLPVHQDGTCNGLQHYAALGGDKAGAAQVNLEPGDRPGDVYTGVLNAVVSEIDEDAANGHPVALKLQGHVTRKVVKQPVMTNVYGVTYYGARAQVQKQLEEIFPDVRAWHEINYSKMSTYVTGKIFRSLGAMFKGAQAIQSWLGHCAETISTSLSAEQVAALTSDKAPPASKPKADGRSLRKKATTERSETPSLSKSNDVKPLFKSTVVWTTPLRLPVVQPYRSSTRKSVTTAMQNIALQEPQMWDPVSKRRQLQAFPPNFIHSLDASHMILSALKCSEVGMSFASIHDSFWTHACDVSSMSTVLRDAFVAMHSDDIVGRLRQEFETRYKGCITFTPVLAKSKVGKEILTLLKTKQWKEAVASVRGGGLSLEVQRLRLLASEDADERERGEAMVTPGSLLAAANKRKASDVPWEAAMTLGEIPKSAAAGIGAEATHEISPAEQVEEPSGAVGDSDAMDIEGDHDDLPEDFDVKEQLQKDVLRERNAKRKIFVWMPISFPEVPEKGGFDVTRLRQSKYFFH